MFGKKITYLFFALLLTMIFTFALSATALATERYEVIQSGDKDYGDDRYVFRLQEELHARGYLERKPTGYFGVETQKALSRYQERNGLTSDGKAGPQTQKKIYGKNYKAIPSSRVIKEESTQSETKKDSKKKTLDPSSISLGDEGSDVTKIQKRLKELGFYTYRKFTSYYGEITEQAVATFQKQNGLTSDGIAGKKTTKALFSSKAKKYSEEKDKSSSNTTSKKTKSVGATKQSRSGMTKVESALDLANSLKGRKYRTGGTGPNTFDCSGFVYYVLKAHGVSTPRTSSEMSRYSAWTKIDDRGDLKKGDLVFFASPGRTSGVGHVGIYIGGSRFIHSSSGSAYGVTISSFSSGSYNSRYQWGRRVFK